MSAKIPSIVEIVRNRIEHRDFSAEQKAFQQEVRAEGDALAKEKGVIVPFYEERAMSATGQTTVAGDQGGQTIPTIIPEIGSALRGNLVLEKLGARIWGGVRANLNLPRIKTQISASWLSENATAVGGQDLFASLALSPYRVTAFLDVSDQLLDQAPLAEPSLRFDLMAALAIAIEVAAINGAGSGANQPLGILNTVGIGAVYAGGAANNAVNVNGAAPIGRDLANLEYQVTGAAKADRGNVGFIFSPYVRLKLRQTSIIPGGYWPVIDNVTAYSCLGHPAGVTPSSPDNLSKGASVNVCSAVICGEFSELFVTLFGAGIAIDALRDANLAAQNLTRIYATAYVNSGVRSPEAFAAMKDALCA